MREIARSAIQLGSAIKRRRNELALTQADLARLAGMHQPTISHIESGQNGSSLEAIFRILGALGLEIELQERQQSSSDDIANIF